LSKTLLTTRPINDVLTNYLFHWSEQLLKTAEDKGSTVIDLKQEHANKKEMMSRLKKNRPELVVLNGHGNHSVVTGHNNIPIVDMANADILKDTIVYARACSSASKLGCEAINKGTKAYIGYAQPFFLLYDQNKVQYPMKDEIASYFLQPSNYVVISLLKGHTAAEASLRSKEASKKVMRKLMSSDAPEGAAAYLRCVWYNMTHQACLGDPEARI
jgi:hypothetical protein